MTLQSPEQLKPLSAFSGQDVPDANDLYKCVHCGLCLNACPTYLETSLETESPRGRIALMKAAHEGRLTLNQTVTAHWSLCLQCRACEAVCPSGVPYGRLMELTRSQVISKGKRALTERLTDRVVFHYLLPYQMRLIAAMRLLRLYQISHLQKWFRGARFLRKFMTGLVTLDAGLPTIPKKFFTPTHSAYMTASHKKGRVVLLSGCVMPLLYPSAMEATVRVLTRNGYDVFVPKGQGCCGALHAHAGVRDLARKLARKNIDIFLQATPDVILTNSAGCGSVMKEYAELLSSDAEYAEKATHFSSIVRDVQEFIATLPFEENLGPMPIRVSYQDPCHLVHAQRISSAPRRLLQAIPQLELVEMKEASVCCGAAGSYTITQRDFSRRLKERKMKHVLAAEADVIATANPGCMLQIKSGLYEADSTTEVLHVIELLDQSYQNGVSA